MSESSSTVRSFLGKQECAVDEKRRFSLPPRFRPLFGVEETPQGFMHRLVLVPWYEGALAAFPLSRWSVIERRLERLDFTTPDFLTARRVVLSRMDFVHSDPEGRVTLNPDLHAWLRLKTRGKDRLTCVGVGANLEIWNAAEWAEFETTRQNSATRPAPDVEYDKKLAELMQVVRELEETEAERERARAGLAHDPPA